MEARLWSSWFRGVLLPALSAHVAHPIAGILDAHTASAFTGGERETLQTSRILYGAYCSGGYLQGCHSLRRLPGILELDEGAAGSAFTVHSQSTEACRNTAHASVQDFSSCSPAKLRNS